LKSKFEMRFGSYTKFAGGDLFDRNLFNRTPSRLVIRIDENIVDLFRFLVDQSSMLIHPALKDLLSDGIRSF
jgi:hypothetical protein